MSEDLRKEYEAWKEEAVGRNPEPLSIIDYKQWLEQSIIILRRELTECKAQIEAMKDCQNCKHSYKYTLMPPTCDECIATSDLKNRYPNWQPKGEKQ